MEKKNTQCNDERNENRLPHAGQKQSPESSESPEDAPRDRGWGYAVASADIAAHIGAETSATRTNHAENATAGGSAKNDNEIVGIIHAGSDFPIVVGDARIDAGRTARIARHLHRVAAERMATPPASRKQKLLSLIAARVWSSTIHRGITRIKPLFF